MNTAERLGTLRFIGVADRLMADNTRLRELLTRIYGWDMMDTAADGPYWRAEMRKLGIKHPDPARVEASP